MKRTDALWIIDNFFYDENGERQDTVFLSDHILKALEEAGMYPPCRRDGKLEWEPEDDNKSK